MHVRDDTEELLADGDRSPDYYNSESVLAIEIQ
jgi:hypothetical protein